MWLLEPSENARTSMKPIEVIMVLVRIELTTSPLPGEDHALARCARGCFDRRISLFSGFSLDGAFHRGRAGRFTATAK
jgi:hypothetical protein